MDRLEDLENFREKIKCGLERLVDLESNIRKNKITCYCCGEKINSSSAIKHYHGYVDCYGPHESEDYFCSKECINAVEVSEMNKEDFNVTFRDCPDLIGII